MKKIFFGCVYLLMLVLIFTYMVIEFENGEEYEQCVLTIVSKTGVSIVGFLFIFPAFVFSIIDLSTNNKMVNLLKNLFSLFSSAFCFASAVICVFMMRCIESIYVPIVLGFCSIIIVIFSLVFLVKILKSEEKKQEC